ncbi:MAG TPA: hypothetical protein VFT38_20375 [Vicinamibacteria bacterium]|nr:hypothetical protein [Vicinamibacteria bacterium]
MIFVVTLLFALAATPAATPSPKPSSEPAARPAPARAAHREGEPVNVRLEIKLTERGATGEPAVKVVSMTVADRANGMIRASGDAPRPAALNVDATPSIDDGKIRLNLGLEYKVTESSPDAKVMPPPVRATRQQIFVILENGRPLVVADSADPATDRRLQVEVTATILR